MTPDVSIIIPCKNEINNIKWTLDSILNSKNKLSFEVIVIDDGSTDGCCDFIGKNDYKDVKVIRTEGVGMSTGRNLGAKEAKGEYLFFCDAHVLVPDYWLDKLVKTLEENDAHAITPTIKIIGMESRGYGGTWNEKLEFTWLGQPKKEVDEIPFIAACAMGVKKDAFDAIDGFRNHFKVYGMEDQEICLKFWLYGYKVLIDSSVEVEHLYQIKHNYEITSFNIIHNFIYMVYSHFNRDNLSKAIGLYKHYWGFPGALAEVMLNEAMMEERKENFNKRVYDENYFLEKFNIKF